MHLNDDDDDDVAPGKRDDEADSDSDQNSVIFSDSTKDNSASQEGNQKYSTSDSSGRETDPLRIYLRQMAERDVLSPEKEIEIAKRLETGAKQVRDLIYQFGFVAVEHLKIIDDCTIENIDGYFEPRFGDSEKDGSPERILLELPQWKQKIQSAYLKLQDAFQKQHSSLSARRKTLKNILLQYPISNEYLEEWYHVALEYARGTGLTATQAPAETKESGTPIPSLRKKDRDYLQGKFLLSVQEFAELLQELKRERDRWREARNLMLESNLRLVVSVAKQFQNRGLPLNDLIQEGNLGLMKAVDKFDYHRGHKFSTYAIWWIKQSISRGIAEQSRVIRIPVHMLETIKKMKQMEQRLLQEKGREPSIIELAASLEMPKERISALRKMAQQAISLQSPINDERDTVLEEIILNTEADSDPTRDIAVKILREKLLEALATLTEREQQILTMRFGLDGNSPRTLVDVSNHFDLTRERIRQIEIKAIEKFRDPIRKKYFDGYLY